MVALPPADDLPEELRTIIPALEPLTEVQETRVINAVEWLLEFHNIKQGKIKLALISRVGQTCLPLLGSDFDRSLHIVSSRLQDRSIFDRFVKIADKKYFFYDVALRRLNHSLTPFHTLDELKVIAEDFLAYLNKNKNDIVNKGRADEPFVKSWWMDWYLGNFYSIEQCDWSPFTKPDASWDDFVPWAYDCLLSSQGLPSTHIGGLDVAGNMNFYLGLRKKLFDLKYDCLTILIKNLNTSSDSLWEKISEYLIQKIHVEDVLQFIILDFNYGIHLKERKLEIPHCLHVFEYGGLMGLFEMIKHFMVEVEIGFFHQVKEAANPMLLANTKVNPSGLSFCHYIEIMGTPHERTFHAAIETEKKLSIPLESFLQKYRTRLSFFLKNDLTITVQWNAEIKACYAEALYKFVNMMKQVAMNSLNLYGRLPGYSLSDMPFKVEIKEQASSKRKQWDPPDDKTLIDWKAQYGNPNEVRENISKLREYKGISRATIYRWYNELDERRRPQIKQ